VGSRGVKASGSPVSYMTLPGALVPVAVTAMILAAAGAGCASLGVVRPAEVTPGASVSARVAASTPPGDDASWIWSLFCDGDCNTATLGYEAEFAYGFEARDGRRAFELGAGLSTPVHPYVQGYVQLREGPRPVGLGARLGVPVWSWHQHQLHLRYQAPLSSGHRLLLNPSLVLHTGTAPNGEHAATFVGFVPAVGLEIRRGSVAYLPAGALVAGWTEREGAGLRERSSSFTLFPTVSIGVRFDRAR
jgi:hypothetical protein